MQAVRGSKLGARFTVAGIKEYLKQKKKEKWFEYTRTEQDIEHSSQSVKDYSKWEDDETDKEKDYRKESEQSSKTQEEPEVMQVTPYQAYDEFQEKHEIPENDDTIFYGAAFDDFNKKWQGVGTSNSDTSGMSGNHADALEETLDIPVPSEYRKLSLTERAKLLPPPSDDRMEELNKYMERMGYTEESMQGIRYKMSVFDEFNDEYDERVKYARERRTEEYEKEQEKQQIVTLTHRNGR